MKYRRFIFKTRRPFQLTGKQQKQKKSTMDAKKLESMKYNELQKLAKQNGIKANMKVSFNTVDQSDSLYIMIVIMVIMNDQFSAFDMLKKTRKRERVA